ncbi:hypothetical protein PhCBS80983_g04740 [Powellomyces hirtus]|uniref:ACT domain-containing protein n=1 Tax=Powellomyces hirtus TaxID=109895 RepID=A0A507DYE7_9FUNG|nr:hypothetical protein PhCBS80983_g04740 [Powellomyces hirtus]
MASTSPTAVFLIVCKDVPGIVAALTSFILKEGGNLVDVDFHTDREEKLFLGRVEWNLDTFNLTREALHSALTDLCAGYEGRWELHFSDVQQRVAVFVSKQDHCLLDLLHGSQLQDVNSEIALVVSNHDTMRGVVESHNIPFHLTPITKATKAATEQAQLSLLSTHKIDLVVMAKYMQILSDDFLSAFPNTINIHHSFLPAFVGAKPYHQAHQRGVKIIGATAHFATVDLDCGPIIEQEVVRVSHRDSVDDLVRKGKDVERSVLARAVRLHLLHRVLTYGNKTVVFA